METAAEEQNYLEREEKKISNTQNRNGVVFRQPTFGQQEQERHKGAEEV